MVLTGLPLNIDFQQILLHLANFAILFFGLYILLYKPVKDFMDKRQAHYKSLDDEANDKLAGAKEKEEEYLNKLNSVDEEIDKKKKEAAAELDTMRVEKEKEAKEKADKIVEDARKEAESVRANIINSASKDITDMVSQAAEKIFMSDDIEKAYDVFLEDAERSVKDGE